MNKPFRSAVGVIILNQRYYVHTVKDYVLFFIITYQTSEQLKTLQETLRSVKLH